MPDTVYLTKGIILEAASCMRLAFLRVRDRGRQKVLTASEEIRLKNGNKVGAKARECFPIGNLIEARDFGAAVEATKAALGAGEPILFEAAFSFACVGVKVDILEQARRVEYELVEVKSGLEPVEYFEDVAVQAWVLQQLGIRIRPYLMLPDKSATITSRSLFKVIPCEAEVHALLPEIGKRIQTIRANVLAGTLPDVPFTRYCRDCDYFEDCLPNLPEHHVFTLYRGAKKIDDLLNKGVRSLKVLPTGTKLTKLQSIQVATIKSGKPWVADGLARALKAGLEYPLFFLDFEVASDPIPEYLNQHPYDPLPFQWSCHVRRSDGAPLEHREFLMDGLGDPRPEFASSLLQCLGDSGSIVVFTHYERTIIKALAGAMPSLKAGLEALIPRLFDLHAVILRNYYHPDFHGSFSIKKVLPVLVPVLSYKGMKVADGMEAVRAYYRLTSGQLSARAHAALAKSLKEYCALDTLAMVKVYEALGRIAHGTKEDHVGDLDIT